MFYIAQKKHFIFVLALIFFILIPALSPGLFHFIVFAAGHLNSPKDIVSTESFGLEHVEHYISFQLPYDSQLISANDYINVYLPNFSNITAPNSVSGGYAGTPSFSVDNSARKVVVTGINVLPGSTLHIFGTTATNPYSIELFDVTITVTEDEEGQIIKNIVNFAASASNFQVEVSASIAPPVAALTVSGYTSPGTFVTILENGTVMGTDTAGINGLFVKYLSGLDPGVHNISIYGIDNSYLSTSIFSTSITTPIYQNTTISGLILSPTININDTEIDLDASDTLSAAGSTIPNGNVTIFTESPLRTYYATASALGAWSVNIDDIDEYNPGDYRIYSYADDGLGAQSIFSNSLQFTVLSSSSNPGDNPDCDISEGDLNCDGIVNLTDFSVLMYYWGTTAAKSDINEDGIVNLTDFSILMYYWGT